MSSAAPRFLQQANTRRPVLAEGAVIERVRREFPELLDPELANALMPLQEKAALALAGIYREYLDIGASAGMPVLVLTPTWKACAARLARRGLDVEDINRQAVAFLRRTVAEGSGACRPAVFVGGLLGPAHDAYRPEQALPEGEAEEWHRPQARALARAGVDLLIASTLPALCEALGVARAMASTGCPFLLSFVLSPEGELLDGTPLGEAISQADCIEPAPAGYLLNCVHPSVADAIHCTLREPHRSRLWGLQANTSRLPPSCREGLPELDTEEPDQFAAGTLAAARRMGWFILGGCCGTTGAHLRALAQRWCSPCAAGS